MDLPVEHLPADIRSLFDPIPSLIVGLGDEHRIVLWNAQAEKTLGLQAREVVGHALETAAIPWDRDRVVTGLQACRQTAEPTRIDGLRCRRTGDETVELGLTVIPLGPNAVYGMRTLLIGADLTERKLLEDQLAQAQKMEAVGHLAAGIAHEISTPTQFVGDNTRFLQEAFADLQAILTNYQALGASVRDGLPVMEQLQAAEAAATDLDLAYLTEEIPLAIDHILDGVSRISKIVRSMKFFAHPGSKEKTPLDINEAIESTIILSRNEWKYVAEVQTDLDPALPPVPGLRGEINQVLLNLMTNAAHAIAERLGDQPTEKRLLHVKSRCEDGWAEIRIRDTGSGIPEAIRHQVFDLFFTTKEEGRGSGQGLAIAHSVIVEKHGGRLTFESAPGKGTTFIIKLPVKGQGDAHGQTTPALR